jgi:hypothetical protein
MSSSSRNPKELKQIIERNRTFDGDLDENGTFDESIDKLNNIPDVDKTNIGNYKVYL